MLLLLLFGNNSSSTCAHVVFVVDGQRINPSGLLILSPAIRQTWQGAVVGGIEGGESRTAVGATVGTMDDALLLLMLLLLFDWRIGIIITWVSGAKEGWDCAKS